LAITLYEFYQITQKILAQIEFARTHNENHAKREKVIHSMNSELENTKKDKIPFFNRENLKSIEGLGDYSDLSDREDLQLIIEQHSFWHSEGDFVGRIDEHMRGYIAVTLIWKELYQAVEDFINPYETSGILNRPKVVDTLLRLEDAILCQCQPNGLAVPYCDIKEVTKGRYIHVEDEDARRESKRLALASEIERDYCVDKKTIALLKSLRFVLWECEEGLGIKRTKSDMHKGKFFEKFVDKIETAQAIKIKIKLKKMNEGKSKELLRNLIISPAGVVYDKAIYGSKQPDGVIDLLNRNGYKTAAENIHIKQNRIYLDKKYRLIEEK